jgi:antitoxin VapB
MEGWTMATAKVFRSGNSQALRLPKQFRLKSKEVEIFRRGDEIVLREKSGHLGRVFDLLAGLPDDFDLSDRSPDVPQKRKRL